MVGVEVKMGDREDTKRLRPRRSSGNIERKEEEGKAKHQR